jgi:hypothetical protein
MFDDCEKLRESLLAGFDALSASTHVARVGAVDGMWTNEQFARVLHDNLTWLNDELEYTMMQEYMTASRGRAYTCAFVPTHVGLDIFYAQTAYSQHRPIYEVVSAYR